jgi:hypothetical protein
MTEFVEFTSGDAGFDVGRDEVQNFRCQATCDAHFFDFLGVFDCDGHGLQGLWRGWMSAIRIGARWRKVKTEWLGREFDLSMISYG